MIAAKVFTTTLVVMSLLCIVAGAEKHGVFNLKPYHTLLGFAVVTDFIAIFFSAIWLIWS